MQMANKMPIPIYIIKSFHVFALLYVEKCPFAKIEHRPEE